MADWLLVEVVAAVLSAVLWSEPAPAEPVPDCGRGTVEVECGERTGGER